MTSILKVDNIQNTSGTAAMTIDGSSNVTFPQNATVTGNTTFNGTVSGITTGKVLQMVTTSSTADTGTITASGAQDLLALAITPSATTSKILILAQAVIEVVGGSNAIVDSDVYRGTSSGTLVGKVYDGTAGIASGNTHYHTVNHSLVDAPSTTSATTYTFTMARGSGGTTSVRNNFGDRYLTLMEIGA